MRYFVMIKFVGSLVHKENFSLMWQGVLYMTVFPYSGNVFFNECFIPGSGNGLFHESFIPAIGERFSL